MNKEYLAKLKNVIEEIGRLAEALDDCSPTHTSIAPDYNPYPKLMRSKLDGLVVLFTMDGAGFPIFGRNNHDFCADYNMSAFQDMDNSDYVNAVFFDKLNEDCVTYPVYTRGKTSGCLYFFPCPNEHIRLTNGEKWTKFRNPIGKLAPANGLNDQEVIPMPK